VVDQTDVIDQQTIAAGWLTLRPFTTADIPWVYEVSLDPVLQRFMRVPSPCRLEDAAAFVEQKTGFLAACRGAGLRRMAHSAGSALLRPDDSGCA
jgi:hypothetical protein